ncbi:MAG: right-handed parallel beta-helix repeat-containing protein, partial [Candidatus Marinimicrobia bacterium]|nr:right-handed parallel beta-helix repeat-containing protein [Candidatus Neomarinimicrobiota bacterium]
MKTVFNYVASSIIIALSLAQAQTWPLNNQDKLSSAFGPRNKSDTAEYPDQGYDYDFHAGIDIGGINGSNVKAIESGTVVKRDIDDYGNYYFVVKSQLYEDWIQYMHVQNRPQVGQNVTGGTVICQVSGNHLDIKWYPRPEDFDPSSDTAPYEDSEKRNLSYHPMYIFWDSDCDPTNDLNYDVDFNSTDVQTDDKGDYMEIYGRVDDQQLDLTTAQIDLTALDEYGYTISTLDILNGNSDTDNIVDYDLRWNCGDLEYGDSDSGNNNPNIRIIPRIFRGGLTGSDSYHTVYFRFYLDPNLGSTSNGQGRASTLDVEGVCYDEQIDEFIFYFLTTNWVEVEMAICPPCPEDAPPAPTNLTASPNINNNMAVDLAWDPVVGPEAGFHVIYRRPYGAPTEAFQSIDITSGETYQDLGCTPGQQYIYAVAGVNYYGEGPNSDDALSTTPTYGTITTRRTWSGDFTITGNVVVNSGAILTVSPGTTARFASGKKLRVYGTLVAEGMSFNPITFTRSGSSGYWDGIWFEDSADDASQLSNIIIDKAKYGVRIDQAEPTLKDMTVTNSQTFGIYVRNSYSQNWSNIHFENITISGGSFGIYMWGSSPTLSNIDISNSTYGLAAITGSSPIISECESNNNTYYGLYTYSSSNPKAYYSATYDFGGYNEFILNRSMGVRARNSSYPNLGGYGYNSIYGNSQYDVSNENSSGYIYAKWNWWDSSDGPDLSKINGSVVYFPWLSSPPGGPELSTASGLVNFNYTSTLVTIAFDTSDELTMFEEAYESMLSHEYEIALQLFQQFLTDYPDSKLAEMAIAEIADIYRTLGMEKVGSDHLIDLTGPMQNNALKKAGQFHSVILLANAHEWEPSLKATKALQSVASDLNRQKAILFHEAMMLSNIRGRGR